MAHTRALVGIAAAILIVRPASGAVVPLDVKRPTIVRLNVAARPLAPASSRQLLRMMHEADAIWRPYGVTLVWVAPRTVGPVSSADVTLRLEFVAHAREAGGSPPKRSGAATLGVIRFLDGDRPDDVIRLSASEVESVVLATRLTGARPESLPSGMVDDMLGRALGRVLAHELGHYLLAVSTHTAAGLMRPVYPGPELAGMDRRGFRLDTCAGDRLRSRVGYLAEGHATTGFALPLGCR